MGYSIDVEGLDEAIKFTEELAHGLTVEGMNEQCKKVKLAARGCGIEENELILEAIPRGKEWDLKFKLNDSSKADCVIEAIRKAMPSTPATSKGLFEELLKNLEKDKKSTSND